LRECGENSTMFDLREKDMAAREIFISHISTETELAQALKRQLDEDFLGMLNVFVSSDQETIGAGVKWLDSVELALKKAELLLILCSTASVSRPWVNFEAGAVWLRGIPVIPVCHSGMKPHELPVPLSMLQAIEASQPRGQQMLYDAIAQLLGAKLPKVDLAAKADSFKKVETKLVREQAEAAAIIDPRVLCASSAQFGQAEYEFDLDVAVIERLFRRNVTVDRGLTSRRLRELLSNQKFDIVHLVLAVDRQNGDLIFKAEEPADQSEDGIAHPGDRMSASAFAALLVESQTSLVVLATCQALLLAVEVGHIANMAASDLDISGEDAAIWAECFYGFLVRGRSLFKSFELTRTQVPQAIRAIRHKDFTIVITGDTVQGAAADGAGFERATSRGNLPQMR
jgi:hypothetical protein